MFLFTFDHSLSDCEPWFQIWNLNFENEKYAEISNTREISVHTGSISQKTQNEIKLWTSWKWPSMTLGPYGIDLYRTLNPPRSHLKKNFLKMMPWPLPLPATPRKIKFLFRRFFTNSLEIVIFQQKLKSKNSKIA